MLTDALFLEVNLKRLNYFTRFEKLLWLFSVAFIILSFVLFSKDGYISLVASLVGVTSLIFLAKGNPFGNVLMIVFSIIYGYISYTFSYYGEMITYVAMTLPMAVFSLISWLRNPYKGNKSQVTISGLSNKIIIQMLLSTIVVTVVLGVVLVKFNTANIVPSILSVATSFAAAFLTYKRTPYFPLAYALNDIVLIVLWVLASLKDLSYVSVVVCFIVFLINDLYGFVSWKKMAKRQKSDNSK